MAAMMARLSKQAKPGGRQEMGKSDADELLSALMDGELSELELRRLLAESEANTLTSSKASQWARWHLAHDILQGNATSGRVDMLACSRISAAIAKEKQPTSLAWRNSVSRVAVAASVALAVVAGWQTWQVSGFTGAASPQLAGVSTNNFSAQSVNDSFRTDLSRLVPVHSRGEAQPVADTFTITIPSSVYGGSAQHQNQRRAITQEQDTAPSVYLASPNR